MESLLQNLHAHQLERREKIILIFGASFMLLFLTHLLIVDPYLQTRKKLQNSINRYQKELVTIAELSQQYQESKENKSNIVALIQTRAADFSLFSFLEENAETAGIKQLVKYMKPSTNQLEGELIENIVEMQLEEINLKQLASFLEHVESKKNVVFIRRISIQGDAKQPGVLDVIVQIVTYNLSE